jgi:hypothetical protein
MQPPADRAAPQGAWYRQPIAWLGVLVFAASLAGCIWIIAVGQRHADVPVPTPAHGTVFGVPTSTLREAAPTPSSSAP